MTLIPLILINNLLSLRTKKATLIYWNAGHTHFHNKSYEMGHGMTNCMEYNMTKCQHWISGGCFVCTGHVIQSVHGCHTDRRRNHKHVYNTSDLTANLGFLVSIQQKIPCETIVHISCFSLFYFISLINISQECVFTPSTHIHVLMDWKYAICL